ncbi:MAG: hypothetical protein IJS01_01890 [Lentisphaeria bacterium]|nr:hypothetical protein [Lentisphaeria bacterium]
MGRFRNSHNWDEFRWESELRRDERRINLYFAELASCLDLPGEEDIIAGLISENTEPVASAAGRGQDVLRGWSYLAPRDEEQDYDDDPAPPRRPEQALINQLDALAARWNMAWTGLLSPEYTPAGLSIACAYGRLLARLADFVDADDIGDRGLKITLGKRTLADINELAEALKYAANYHRTLRGPVIDQLETLSRIRDRVVTLLGRVEK